MSKKKKVKIIPDKIPSRVFYIIDPIFRIRIHILLNVDEKGYERFLNRNKVKDITERDLSLNKFQGFSTSFLCEDGRIEFVILLKEFQWAILHQGTLIHEIVHTVMKIHESNNIPFNCDTQEFIAHSIARIYEMISKKLLVIKK